nr:guanitoxin biosynthesis heme-dependent pre-guanitoxin N-hydroxylase GntA [Archangium primigenium]
MRFQASAHLHQPSADGLKPLGDASREVTTPSRQDVQTAMRDWLDPKSYPCIPAVQSMTKHEYLVGLYGALGQGRHNRALAQDLLFFREQQRQSQSLYLSFWAVFAPEPSLSEEEFEARMWRELSFLTSHTDLQEPWDPLFSSDPADPRFCFSLGGDAFFIVGAHPRSSRLARRFPYPAVIFNLYDQFEELDRRGQYTAIVRKNRERDVKFQGSVNPMVEQYGDKWESIQFSGRQNTSEWKCPFQHGLKPPESTS